LFPLSFLALKYSYFRRVRKKSVTAADRGEQEKKVDSEHESWRDRNRRSEQ